MPVTERDMGYKRIMRELAKLEDTTVSVGIQSNAGGDIIERAFFNEFGTSRAPERSFIRAAFDENRKDLDTTINRLWNGVKLGRVSADDAARILGDRHEGQVKQKVRTGPFEPNAPATVAAKGSSRPLIDTAEMVNSIRYEVD